YHVEGSTEATAPMRCMATVPVHDSPKAQLSAVTDFHNGSAADPIHITALDKQPGNLRENVQVPQTGEHDGGKQERRTHPSARAERPGPPIARDGKEERIDH